MARIALSAVATLVLLTSASNAAGTPTAQLATPGIQIAKFVNGQDANSTTGPHVVVNSTLTFTYVVTNTGDVPLANVVVSDDKLGTIAGPASGDTNSNGLLDLTETWTFVTTAAAFAGQQTNVGTVTAQDANNPPGTSVNDTDPANYFGDFPGIQIAKFVNGQDANSPPGPHVPEGSTVTFTYVVTNTGNVPLANLTVTDDKLGPITSFVGDANNNGLLDLTETWTYTATATALAGHQTNFGTVTAQDANNPPGETVSASDPANYFGDVPTAVQLRSFTAAAGARGILVRWRTASEVGLLGFNVYRGTRARKHKLNHSLIRAKERTAGAAYSWLDHGAKRGSRYWLQAVSADGSRRWYGAVRSTGS